MILFIVLTLYLLIIISGLMNVVAPILISNNLRK